MNRRAAVRMPVHHGSPSRSMFPPRKDRPDLPAPASSFFSGMAEKGTAAEGSIGIFIRFQVMCMAAAIVRPGTALIERAPAAANTPAQTTSPLIRQTILALQISFPSGSLSMAMR